MTDPSLRPAVEWLSAGAASLWGEVLFGLTGQELPVTAGAEGLADPSGRTFSFNLRPFGIAALTGDEAAWNTLAQLVVGDEPGEYLSTSQEMAQQFASLLARKLASTASREVESIPAETGTFESAWTLEAKTPEGTAAIHLLLNDALLRSVQSLLGGDPSSAPSTGAVRPPKTPGARNLEILLDVEMPIAISFGRANLPLKDVMKLAAGSIVELNRTVAEPVEVIVNDCVVARGEVVVVDGNYGVRLTEIVSRQERLRTVL
jgi:flagellar motor switch protein FliN/FliY